MKKRKELVIGLACLAVLALVCTSTVPSVQAAHAAAGARSAGHCGKTQAQMRYGMMQLNLLLMHWGGRVGVGTKLKFAMGNEHKNFPSLLESSSLLVWIFPV